LRVIVKNPNLETQEKVDVIGTTWVNINTLAQDTSLNDRAKDAFTYILRLFESKRSRLLQGIKTMTSIFL
jgi:hypothetical protein